MSALTFPPTAGTTRLAWSNIRAPEFRTLIAESSNGLEARNAKWTYPRWRWTVSYEVLGESGHEFGDQLRPVLGFFLQHKGSADSFLFQDPEDYRLVDQPIGTGNATTKNFQTVRTYGGFTEPVWEIKSGTLVVKKRTPPGAAVVQTYTATNPPPGGQYTEVDGLIIFGTAPAAADEITVSCDFYWRVRFALDLQEVENFSYLLHAMREVGLVSVKR